MDWEWSYYLLLSTLLDLWKHGHCCLCLKYLLPLKKIPTPDLEWISWLPLQPNFPFVVRWCSCLLFSSSHSSEQSQGLLANRWRLLGIPTSWSSWLWQCSWMESLPSWRRSHVSGRWRWQEIFAKNELEGNGQKATNLDKSSMYQENWNKDTSDHPKK